MLDTHIVDVMKFKIFTIYAVINISMYRNIFFGTDTYKIFL